MSCEAEDKQWNKDGTELLPEYGLTYGHTVAEAEFTPAEIKRVGRIHKLGELQYAGGFAADRIPREPRTRRFVLGNECETHLLVSEAGGHSLLFGSHKLFYSSQGWMDWNSRTGGLMAFVHQLEDNQFFYIIFRKGKRLMDAVWEDHSIRYIDDLPIEVRLGGKRVFHDPGAKAGPTAEIAALLAADARISDESGDIRIIRLSSGEVLEPLTHYIFSNPTRRPPGRLSRMAEKLLHLHRWCIGIPDRPR